MKVTVPIKYNKSIDKLLTFMYSGGKISHEDWAEGEWISIKNGEFITESGNEFTISPWMICNNKFGKYEELVR